MNRLSRDELCHAALNLADMPTLEEHDRPAGAILQDAWSVQWLQFGIDLAHRLFPFAATLAQHSFNTVPGIDLVVLPTNFNAAVRDGIRLVGVGVNQRLGTSSIENLLEYQASNPYGVAQRDTPVGYVISPPNLYLYPTPKDALTGTMWYYTKPNLLTDGTKIPQFPEDTVLVKYLFWEMQEWARKAEPGTAEKYLIELTGKLQAAGHGREPNRVDIPMDQHVYRQGGTPGIGDWMGKTTL